MSVRRGMIEKDYLTRSTRKPVADVCVYPAFPVAMAKPGGCRGDSELVRNEVIMRDCVRGEMREIAKPERTHRLGPCFFVNLESDIPGMTMPARCRVFLGDARIRGDASVKEIIRERGDDLRNRRGKQRE